MFIFSQMFIRLVIALGLGALLGLERELVGKEAGTRTEMLVCAGAAMFSMIALSLPYIISAETGNLTEVIAGNGGFLQIIANIVVGIGFLGAGLIIKTDERARGITTAASVWTTAAIGVMVGIGMIEFAVVAAFLIVALLYLLRKMDIADRIEKISQKDVR